jgi:hypothetical protein
MGCLASESVVRNEFSRVSSSVSWNTCVHLLFPQICFLV